MKKAIGIVLFLTLALTGCDKTFPEPTIDSTTDESLEQSSQEVRDTLSEEKRKEFDSALKIVALSQISFKDILTYRTGSAEKKMKDSLHGRTAQEVIDEAAKITAERKAREKQQALDEIKELELKKVEAEKAKTELKKFQVVRSRFYKEKQQYLGEQPIIEITVKNNTTSAVSRAYFEGTIASPNRSVPWLKETFSYSIAGGLEAGEEQSWRLAPGMFSDWGKTNAPDDAVFTVVVTRIDGADGKALYSTSIFSERDSERLKKLKTKFEVQ